MAKKEVGHLYIFTYKNLQGGIVKTGIRDNNKKDAREYFINTHSAGCQILDIETKYNYI